MLVDSITGQQLESQLRQACGELNRRVRNGQRRVAEQMLVENPDLAAQPECALELIYTEFVILEELEQPLDPEDLCARFPQHRDALYRLLYVHQVFHAEEPSASIQTSINSSSTRDGLPSHADTVAAQIAGRIGDHELLEQIGAGGMAVVYKARHVGLNRLVALKLIRAERGKECGQDRFRSEAEAAARLQHPNIVQIFEIGRHEGYDYLSLEYVDGGSLEQHVSAAQLTFRRSAEIVQTLACAIHHAHERGIIHRDLKPANILLTGKGELKIADFGLAKHVDEASTRQTETGAVMGTPAYMSPEQAAGQSAHIGPGSDIYGLGAILYELLTGRPPFHGRSKWDLLERIVRLEPAPPRRLCPEVPRDLNTICLRCLEKEPHKRYGSAAQLAADLGRFLDGQPIYARPVGWTERMWKWTRRRPAVAALVAVSLLTALMLTALLVGYHVHTELDRAYQAEARQRKKTESTLVLATAAQQQAELAWRAAERAGAAETAAREKLEEVLYFRRIWLANEAWQQNRVGRARTLLEECPSERRQWEWYYVNRLCHPDCTTLREHRDFINAIDFSPDRRHLASASYDGTTRIWDLDTCAVVRTIQSDAPYVVALDYSPDGRQLAIGHSNGIATICDAASGDERLRVASGSKTGCSVVFSPDGHSFGTAPRGGAKGAFLWDVHSGQKLRTLNANGIFCLQFSPDGRRVVSTEGYRVAKVFDVDSGQETMVLNDAWYPIFSPDGQQLASLNSDSSIKISDSRSGRELFVLRGHKLGSPSIAFSPDGRQLVSGHSDTTVRLWNLENKQEVHTFKGHTHVVYDVAFSPDGTHIASAGLDSTIRIWSTAPTMASRVFQQHTAPIRAVTLSPDLRRVVSSARDLTARVWDASSGKELLVLRGHTSFVWPAIFSPDGKRLATGGRDRTVRIWDAATGEQLFVLACEYNDIDRLAFSPDSQRLASIGFNFPTLAIWDARTGEHLKLVQAHSALLSDVAYSPDGRYLVTAGQDSRLTIWDATTYEELHTLSGHTYGIWCTAFSPDGSRLASAGGEGKFSETNAAVSVKIWNVHSGVEILSLSGDTDVITSLCFSPDGRRLAAGSGDQSIRLWDLESGHEAITIPTLGTEVYSLAFSPDGRRLYSGSATDTICYFDVWDAGPEFQRADVAPTLSSIALKPALKPETHAKEASR